MTAQTQPETSFDRGAWAALGASSFLITAVLVVNAYRLTLPTDGWNLDDFRAGLSTNVLGLPSEIQPGDIPIAIEGVPIKNLRGALPPNWRVGEKVQYLVKRGEATLTVAVPIGSWNLAVLPNWILVKWSNNLIALLYFLIGAFVFRRRPSNLAAQALFFLGSVRLVMDLVYVVPPGIGDYGNLFAITAKVLLGNYIWGLLLFPTFLLLSLVFPRPKRPFRTHPRLTLAFLYLTEPSIMLFIGNPFADIGAYFGFGLVAVFGLLTVASVIHTVITARGDMTARAQILWVGLGVGLVAGFQFAGNVLLLSTNFATVAGSSPWWLDFITALIYLALPTAFAVAILRYRLFDIDIIIRRALQYSLLSGLLALTYFGLIIVLQSLFTSVSGQSSPVVTVLSTLAIAVLFLPLRRWVQDAIDRRFYRRKYDAAKVIADFAATCRDETDLDNLTARLVEVVDETMQPESVMLWLKPTHEQKQEQR